MHRFARFLCTLTCAALLASGPATAQTPDTVIAARILPGWQTADGTRMSGLELRMAPGWKTYWRAPGDAGIPPSFDWTGSRNLAGVTVHWPRPQVYHINGMRSIGYKDAVVLPLEIAARQPGAPVTLRAEVSLGVCEDICIPVSLQVDARLAGAGGGDTAIADALAARPRPAQAQITCTVTPIADGMALAADIRIPRLGRDETVVVEPSDTRIWVSEPSSRRSGATLRATAELVPPQARPFALNRGALRFTVIGADDAVEMTGCSAR